MDNVDEIVKEFLVESSENLDRLDRDLVELEKHPSDREILASIFRTIHTIKGTSGFLGFSKLEAVAHIGENLLAKLRDGHLNLDAERTSGLLAMVDAVREMLASIEQVGNEGQRDDQGLITRLTGLLNETSTAPAAAAAAAPISAPEAPPPSQTEPHGQQFGDILVSRGAVTERQVEAAVEKQQMGDPRRVGEILVEQGAIKPQEVLEGLRTQQEQHPQEPSQNTIRVNVKLLDQLMNLVGELVLARNQILQYTRTTEESNLINTGQRLNLIATELQEGVMKTRMQPIGSIWSRFPRTVRDIAVACGKHVRIEMVGQETELDKTLIEAIKDPMTHLVRNAVDHGIESSEARVAAGKNPEGVLLLRAYHEGGQVNIEISDDGAGLNVSKVIEKAVQKGLITAERAARLNDREAANLIFLAGLSTAEKVTNVSGRGVGMDVVKTNIERIGGTVDLQSTPGHGTTVKVKIPLTLAIVPALIVTAGGQRFAIPQVSLLELVGLSGHDARERIEMVQGVPIYRLRGNLLPLVRLKSTLRIEGGDGTEGANRSEAAKALLETNPASVNIVVLQADGEKFGLVVDEISDTEEIVVKPLGKHLKNVSVFAGATIMGDGKVALILDVLGLAQHAHVVAENREHKTAEEAKQAHEAAHHKQSHPLLLFRLGESGRMAIDLSSVARLEEFSGESIELAGELETVQYRGQIMPLVRLSQMLDPRYGSTTGKSGPLQVVVVYGTEGRNIGFIVDRILDIVDEAYALDAQTARPGVMGSAVIQQRITDIVDVGGVIASMPMRQAVASGD